MGEGGWGLIVNTYVHCTHSAVIKCSQFIENDTFRTERLVHCKQLRDSDHDAVFFFFFSFGSGVYRGRQEPCLFHFLFLNWTLVPVMSTR